MQEQVARLECQKQMLVKQARFRPDTMHMPICVTTMNLPCNEPHPQHGFAAPRPAELAEGAAVGPRNHK